MSRPLWVALAGMVLACMLAACNHREFLMEEPSGRVPVLVEIDWSEDPEAAPAGMSVIFFRDGVTRPVSYNLSGRDGGRVLLHPGIYSVLCHNNDSDRHGFVGTDSYHEYGIRLNDNRNPGSHYGISPGMLRGAEERIAHSPDSMWIASVETFEVHAPLVAASKAEPDVLRLTMHPVVARYTFFIHNPVNFRRSMSVGATVSGMAGTVHPGRGATGDETVTHFFGMTPTDDGGLFGEFLTFGHCGGREVSSRADDVPDGTHMLTVHAVMADGSLWNYTHDITDKIHGSGQRDCEVHIDSIAFPPSGGGGGLSPTVGGWTGTKEEVGM